MRYFILLLCLVILFSCNHKKEGITTVEGLVVDEPEGEPLPNFNLVLYSEVSDFLALDNGKTNNLQNITTDANGRFATSFEADDRHIYFIGLPEMGVPNYCSALANLKSAKKNIIEVKAKRSGIIKLNVINESPVDTAQEFLIDYLGGSRQNYFLKDTVAYFQRCSGQKNTIRWKIRSAGIVNEGEKSVIPGAWDTTEIEIRF